MSHDACPILHVLSESIHRIFLFLFFVFYWSILIELRFDCLCPICHILIVSYIIVSCLSHVVGESIQWIFLYFFVFLLKYSKSNMIRLPRSVMSHLKYFVYLIFLSHKHIPRNRTFSCFSYFCWHSHLSFLPDVDCSQPQPSPPVAVRCHHCHRHSRHRYRRHRHHCRPQ